MKARKIIFILILASILAPLSQAQQPGGAAGHQQQYAYRELSAISGLITASTMEVWFTSPISAGSIADVSYIGFNVAGPDIPTGGIATFTASTITSTGCTVGSWTTVSETLAAGTGASSYAAVTLTSADCSGVAEMIITAGVIPTTLGRFRFPFNIHVEPTSFTNTVNGGLTVTDDANGWNVNAAVTGSLSVSVNGGLTVTLAPGGSIAVTGIPDTQQEIQAVADAVALLQNLNVDLTGTVNVAQSGAWTIGVSQSGAWTISDDVGGWAIHQDPLSGTIALTGIPDTQQEIQAVADAIALLDTMNINVAGSLTVTDDADGWNIHQDPVSGTLELTGVDITSTVNNSTINAMFPDEYDVRLSNDFDGLDAGAALALLVWIAVMVWCMRNAKLFCALAATVGVACVLIPGPEYVAWVGILLFVVVAWLEAVAREKLPYHWFKGTGTKQ